jgi:hypothetical protein
MNNLTQYNGSSPCNAGSNPVAVDLTTTVTRSVKYCIACNHLKGKLVELKKGGDYCGKHKGVAQDVGRVRQSFDDALTVGMTILASNQSPDEAVQASLTHIFNLFRVGEYGVLHEPAVDGVVRPTRTPSATTRHLASAPVFDDMLSDD